MKAAGTPARVALLLGVGLAAFTFLEGRWGGGLLPSLLSPSNFVPARDYAAFFVRYFLVLAGGLAVFWRLPPPWRDAWLVALSAAYLGYESGPALPAAMAAWTLGLRQGLRFRRAPWRDGAFVLALALFFAWVSTWALKTPSGSLRDLILLPGNLLPLGVLYKSFKRSVYAWYEAGVGRIGEVPLKPLAIYLWGFQFLLPFSVTPSLADFLSSREGDPGRVAARGAATGLVCVGCGVSWFALTVVLWSPEIHLMPLSGARSMGLGQIWLLLGALFVLQYLYRMSSEQFSVGVARLFGYDLRDNFDSPLLSRGLVDFWRRWNLLWREFLLSWAYYPVLLRLGRRYGPRTPWIFPVACLAAFMASALFNIFPFALFLLPLKAKGLAIPFAAGWLLYDMAMGVMVGAGLYLRALRPDLRWPRWSVPAQVVLAFAVIAFTRALTYMPVVPLGMKLDLMQAALGLR